MAEAFEDSVLVETTPNGKAMDDENTPNGKAMDILEEEKGRAKMFKTTEKENGKEDRHTEVEDEKPNADGEGDSESLDSKKEHTGKSREEPKEKKSPGQARGRKKTAILELKSEGKVSEGKKRLKKEPATPSPSLFIDRPTRERKSIDRFVASVEKEKVREVKIEKGAGTLLKDIPNVVYMVSKRTGSDDSLQLLHKLLYGKRMKHQAKQNILQFSGYVWGSDQEKEKGKVKERLEKCNRDSLFQVFELLDLSISKSGKKEDVVAKLFEFLESPQKTRDVLTEETMKGKRQKKRSRKSLKGRKSTPVQTPRKRQKGEGTPRVEKRMEVEKDDGGDDWDEDEDDVEAENEEGAGKRKQPQKASDDDDYNVKGSASKQKRKRSAKKIDTKETTSEESSEDEVEKVKSPVKVIIKSPSRPVRTPGQTSAKGATKSKTRFSKGSSRKEQDGEQAAEEIAKASPLEEKLVKGKISNKETVKETEKSKKGAKRIDPSDEELRAAICDLLEDADFSKDTFADVIKKLEKKLNFDLSQKKTHVKFLIHEEIRKTPEEDAEEDNVADEGGRDREESNPGDVADQLEE